jgi:hypothetical protein
MKQVTLSFPSLGDLAECMFYQNVRRPLIDYDKYTFTAELTDAQIEGARKFNGTLVRPDEVISWSPLPALWCAQWKILNDPAQASLEIHGAKWPVLSNPHVCNPFRWLWRQ